MFRLQPHRSIPAFVTTTVKRLAPIACCPDCSMPLLSPSVPRISLPCLLLSNLQRPGLPNVDRCPEPGPSNRHDDVLCKKPNSPQSPNCPPPRIPRVSASHVRLLFSTPFVPLCSLAYRESLSSSCPLSWLFLIPLPLTRHFYFWPVQLLYRDPRRDRVETRHNRNNLSCPAHVILEAALHFKYLIVRDSYLSISDGDGALLAWY